ncbi:MAG: DUF364 domain-containing protein [Syntrophomonas sp.]|jgi:uncharacterized protein (DUF4213/DUF364 family)|nr:DUF364 domain-containing protein [Syntrophomonas sp.]
MNNIILTETINQLRDILGESMEQLTVERAVIGLFFTGVKLSNGHGGLCFTPIKEIPEAVCCPSSAKAMPLSGKLAARNVNAYLEDIFKDNILKKALGIATLNALSATCWDIMKEKSYAIELGKNTFDTIEIDPAKKTVVVGALVPIIRKLVATNADFHILEMDASTLKPNEMPYFAEANRAPEFVPDADLLVITGTTIINDTLPELLAMAKPGAQIVVTGPTVSMLPDAFFTRGVTSLGGILVTNPDEILDIISEGGSGYHFFGKSAEMLIINKQD